MKRIAMFVAMFVALAVALLAHPAHAAGAMSEAQAKAAAVKILKGDPYGRTDNDVMKNIAGARLVTAGKACDRNVKKPVWQFQVLVPKSRNPNGGDDIKGYLVIDGRTGKWSVPACRSWIEAAPRRSRG